VDLECGRSNNDKLQVQISETIQMIYYPRARLSIIHYFSKWQINSFHVMARAAESKPIFYMYPFVKTLI